MSQGIAIGPDISVMVDESDLAQYQASLERIPKGFEKVITRAINKLLVKAHNEISKAIRADLPIKAGELKKKYLRRFRATYRKLYARILITGRRIPLSKLGARQLRRGVAWGKGASRKTLPGTFMATMRSGHLGAYKRTGKARLPITELHGPSIPQVFENLPQFGSAFERRLVEDLANELMIQADVLLRREFGRNG